MSKLVALACAMVVASVSIGSASGAIGFYGIVEKVVFEPNERSPERIQVWGAFAYADARRPQVSAIKRGYLYFKLPVYGEAPEIVRKEWTDLKSVAGTGQAIGFGYWGYIMRFETLRPDVHTAEIFERGASRGVPADLRVRPAAEQPSNPAAYQTNAGVVKLSELGSNAELVKRLRDALKP